MCASMCVCVCVCVTLVPCNDVTQGRQRDSALGAFPGGQFNWTAAQHQTPHTHTWVSALMVPLL